jgi:hypothetical protein
MAELNLIPIEDWEWTDDEDIVFDPSGLVSLEEFMKTFEKEEEQ